MYGNHISDDLPMHAFGKNPVPSGKRVVQVVSSAVYTECLQVSTSVYRVSTVSTVIETWIPGICIVLFVVLSVGEVQKEVVVSVVSQE